MLYTTILFLATTTLTVCVRAGPIFRSYNSTLHEQGDTISPYLTRRTGVETRTATGRNIVRALQPGVNIEALLKENGLHLTEPEPLKLVNSVIGIFDAASHKILPQTMEKLKDKVKLYVEYEIHVMAVALQRTAPWGIHRVSTGMTANTDGGVKKDFKALSYDYRYEDSAGGCAIIYVVDTGIYHEHTEFDNNRVTWGKIFVKKGANKEKADKDGHGTMVASIAGGKQFGIAKKAHMVAVKIGNSATFRGGDLIAALDWIGEQHAKDSSKPTIVNISAGTEAPCELTDLAATKLIEKGIYVVAAAGNDGKPATEHSPARVKEVITVGASTLEDTIWEKSSHGPLVDLFAPGVKVPAASIEGPKANTAAKPFSGTSFSAPHVSGLIAYLSCLNPGPIRERPEGMAKKLLEISGQAKDQHLKGTVPPDTHNNHIAHMPKPRTK